MNASTINKMTTIERIQVMELLWNALCHDEEEIESPGWHEEILKKRRKKIESGKTKFIPLSEIKTHFNK
jgi:hypothetical protein